MPLAVLDSDFFVLLVLPLQECLKVETIPLLALCVYNPESWVAMNLSVAEAREVRRNLREKYLLNQVLVLFIPFSCHFVEKY